MTKGRKRKWTHTIRKLLYEELMKRFGPYNSWGKGTPTGKEKEYDEFCENFAIIVSIISESKTTKGAVQNQIAWATTCQEKIENQAHVFIENISVALETGFLEPNNIPETILMERKNPHK